MQNQCADLSDPYIWYFFIFHMCFILYLIGLYYLEKKTVNMVMWPISFSSSTYFHDFWCLIMFDKFEVHDVMFMLWNSFIWYAHYQDWGSCTPNQTPPSAILFFAKISRFLGGWFEHMGPFFDDFIGVIYSTPKLNNIWYMNVYPKRYKYWYINM